jgi:hypothetical protein
LVRPAQNISRSSRFTILPVPVLGSGVSRNSNVRGNLEPGDALRQKLAELLRRQRLARLQHHEGRRDLAPFARRAPPPPRTPEPPGCAKMAFSTSSEEMFSPPLMMMSFFRSTMWM